MSAGKVPRARPTLSLPEVLRRLTPEGIVELWRKTWGAGGPHNKGPVDMEKLRQLSDKFQGMPPGTPPWVAAGCALHAITYGRPFWDCNKRTGWTVCATIMSAVGYSESVPKETIEQLVLAVENGDLTETETVEAVRKTFSLYRARSS